MAEHWKDIDLALIREASKIHPDFVLMEQLIRDGADVNAVHCLGDENALSDVIVGWDCEECEHPERIEKDDLPAVIEFFLKQGFDPSRDEGRAGAKCITNITWTRCDESRIPAMKLLLDAGCKNIPPWKDEPDGETPMEIVAGESSFLGVSEGDLDAASTFDALYAIMDAKKENRQYSGIERYTHAYGQRLKHVFMTKPTVGDPFFTLNEPTSKHDNCFRGSLYFELERGWLVEENAVSLYFDTTNPHEEITEVTDAFSQVVESVLTKVSFDKHSIAYGTTYYGQAIMRFHFFDRPILITQTNFGEILDAKTVAYYRYEEDTHK